MFWTIFTVAGLLADIALPWKWSLGATLPLGYLRLVDRLPQRLVLVRIPFFRTQLRQESRQDNPQV